MPRSFIKFFFTFTLEDNEPKITIFPSGTISRKIGSKVIFTCQASLIAKQDIIGVAIKWKYKSLSLKGSLPKRVTSKTLMSNSTKFTSSQLTISDAQKFNSGKYYCLVVLLSKDNKNYENFNFSKMVDIEMAEMTESMILFIFLFSCRFVGF